MRAVIKVTIVFCGLLSCLAAKQIKSQSGYSLPAALAAPYYKKKNDAATANALAQQSSAQRGIQLTWNHGGRLGSLNGNATPMVGLHNLATEKTATVRGIPVTIQNRGGVFGGPDFFIESLLKNLEDDTISQLRRCDLALKGDPTISRGRRVWIIVNGEDKSGEEVASMALREDPQARILILGNLWNQKSQTRIMRNGSVTSMWVPFASTHFAERHVHSPMDLYDRSRISFEREKKGVLAYMQSNCVGIRQEMFNSLNAALCSSGGTGASALSGCQGHTHQEGCTAGYTNRDFVNCDATCQGIYDLAVGRYEDFRFVLTLEHDGMNEKGYITEKIVNALLAGAIPIADKSWQRAQVFRPESYIATNPFDETSKSMVADEIQRMLSDSQAYDSMRRNPVVSEQSLRDFFSWHPAVWPTHGDSLRREIVNEILELCK